MSKKWYNYFVTLDQASASSDEGAASDPRVGQTVAEMTSAVPERTEFAAPVSNPNSFDEIYAAAEIKPPDHGYTIYKIAELLQSEHIRNLSADVKKSSILLALDAAGVKLQDVIEDAVRRDRALDGYERVQQKALEQLEARKVEENRQIQAEMERMAAEHRTRIQANSEAVSREKKRVYHWLLQKQQEEQKIADAVAYFVAENPITVGGAPAAPSNPSPRAQGS